MQLYEQESFFSLSNFIQNAENRTYTWMRIESNPKDGMMYDGNIFSKYKVSHGMISQSLIQERSHTACWKRDVKFLDAL